MTIIIVHDTVCYMIYPVVDYIVYDLVHNLFSLFLRYMIIYQVYHNITYSISEYIVQYTIVYCCSTLINNTPLFMGQSGVYIPTQGFQDLNPGDSGAGMVGEC